MTKEAKHTSGPWERNGDTLITDEPDAKGLAIKICEIVRTLNYKANAALIAASPCLLEALKEAHAMIADVREVSRKYLCEATNMPWSEQPEEVRAPDAVDALLVKIEAAIRKAEGRDDEQ